MHELLVDLFPWVVALYLLEGLAQPGRGHLLLVAGARGRFALRRAGVHLLGLSPFTEVVGAQDLPFLRAGDTLYLFDPRRRSDPALVAGEDLTPLPLAAASPAREGRRVRLAEGAAVVAPTAAWAERLRAELAAAAGAPDRAPDPGRLDVGAARALRARQRGYLAALRAIAGLASAVALVLWPAAAYAPDRLPVPAGLLLASFAALAVAAAAVTYAMLVACGETRGAAAAAALHLVAYPIAALRPLLHGSRSLYRRFDAVAIAAALLPREAFRRFAGRELWRARLSRAATPPALAPFWEARARAIGSVLAQAGIAEAEALVPEPGERGAAGFCPLCGGQYRAAVERCGDCGVEVLPLAAPAPAREA